MDEYISKIKTREEFLNKFTILFNYLYEKENKTKAEIMLLNRLITIYEFIFKHVELPYKKSSYCNMLPYFEFNGGFEMMDSEIGKEATDLLYYFVQNY